MKSSGVYYEYANFRALRSLNHNNIELYLISCGKEQCTPKHFFGPGIRDKFLIHFVLSGKGTFCAHGKTYDIHKNQAFVFYPGETVQYIADKDDPWTYTWVGFNGTMAESYLNKADIFIDTDVFDIPSDSIIPDIIHKMLSSNTLTYANELLRQAYLLELLATLISYNHKQTGSEPDYNYPQRIYTEQAVLYISKEYMNDILVSDIAKRIGITRSYLVKCFNHTLNMSPKQFLIKYRMDKACELLSENRLNISETAIAVGYSNSSTFSKAFKLYFGVSPIDWRLSKRQETI